MKSAAPTIRSIVVRSVVVPLRLPLQTSTTAVETAPLVLIDLQTSAGVTGHAYLFAAGRANLKPIVALVEAMAQMMRVNSEALRAVTESQAESLKSIASARGFFRNATPVPPPDPTRASALARIDPPLLVRTDPVGDAEL